MSTMCRDRQRGFGVVAAIFILVILAGLAAAITMVSTAQHQGSALDIQSSRAYQAARAGIEWGLYQALKTSSCTAAGTTTDIGPLDGIAVTVQCTATAAGDAREAGLGTIYTIVSVACNLPAGTACPGDATSTSYVERRVSALAEKP